MQIIHQMTMDLAVPLPMIPVTAVQGDGNTRVLAVTLLEDGAPWQIPEAAVVDVAFRKPDGTKGIYSRLPDGSTATSREGNVLHATLAPQMLTCPGAVQATVVFRTDGNKTLAAFPFTVTVEANPAAGAAVSEDYFNPTQLSDLRAELAAGLATKAPAGFGLGANGASNATAYTVVDRAGADNLGHSGLYWFYDNANPIFPSGWNTGSIGLIEHQQHSLYHVVNARQVFYPGYNGDNGESTSHLVRVKNYTGVWQPWEWVDPPMLVNTEYRTTERWCGRPVFTMLVDCHDGPNKSITETPIPIPEGAGYFERAIFCSIHGANSSIVMPVMGFDVTADFGCGGILGNIIRISSNVDSSSIHYYATVKYLKQGI